MIMKERVLVVGANGFIGKHLINELISNEIPVTAIIKNNSDTAKLKKLGCYNIIRTNNFNDSAVIRQLLISRPKYIINCAWEKNNKNILLPVENTQILIELLKLTEAINCEGFINIGRREINLFTQIIKKIRGDYRYLTNFNFVKKSKKMFRTIMTLKMIFIIYF